MAWSIPSNAVSGTQIPAATTNAILADLALLGGASTTFGTITSVWSGSGGGTPVIGAGGTFTSTYRQDSKWVDVTYQIVLGTGFTLPTGTWLLALPVGARNFTGIWTGRALDVSVSTTIGTTVTIDITGTSILGLRCPPTTAGNPDRVLNATQPFTWAAGDVLTLSGRYEAI